MEVPGYDFFFIWEDYMDRKIDGQDTMQHIKSEVGDNAELDPDF